MTDISYTSRALAHGAGNPDAGPVTAPNTTWRLAIAATALALLLGLGAAGLQSHNQAGGEANLDGRGKWAGYM
jgi:hypothetical protein